MATRQQRSTWTGFRASSSAPHKLYQTPPIEALGQAITVSDVGDVYPLSKNSAEEQLSADALSSGYVCAPLSLTDEWLLFPYANFSAQRQRLQQRIAEAAQQPLLRRTPKTLPSLSVANREQKDEWLTQLASSDAALEELAGRAPHGLKAAALLDELHTRGVSVVRALWFVRLVYRCSVPDGARVRVAASARSKLWGEDLRRYLEQLLHDTAAAHRPQPSVKLSQASLAALASLLGKFQYVSALAALSFEQGLLSRVRWLDWIIEQIAAVAGGLLSLSSALPPAASWSQLQQFTASFSLWFIRSGLVLALLSPYTTALVQSRYHCFRVFASLTTLAVKLRQMPAVPVEQLSRSRMLAAVTELLAALEAAVPSADGWEKVVSRGGEVLDVEGRPDEGPAEDEAGIAQLLVIVEECLAKGEGRERLVGAVCASAVHEGCGSNNALHALMEWAVRPDSRRHVDAVAGVFSLVCDLHSWKLRSSSTSATRPEPSQSIRLLSRAWCYREFLVMDAASPSSLLDWIRTSVQSFALRFPLLPIGSSRAAQFRLVQLLAHFAFVGLFDVRRYIQHLQCNTYPVQSAHDSPASSFYRLALHHLPLPAGAPTSVALGLLADRSSEPLLFQHALAVLLQRAPVMDGGSADSADCWAEMRANCLRRCIKQPANSLNSRISSATFPLHQHWMEGEGPLLTPPSLMALLSSLPFRLTERLLRKLARRFLSFARSTLADSADSAAWRLSPVRVYLDRLLHFVLFLLETSPHFPLLLSVVMEALQLSSDHALLWDDALFALCRRRFSLLIATNRLPQVHTVMSAHMNRQTELVTAELYLLQAGLPSAFTQTLRADVVDRWHTRPSASALATVSPYAHMSTVGRTSLSGEEATELLDGYRKQQLSLAQLMSSLLKHGVNASTVVSIQREICRQVLILALAPPSATVAAASLYSAPPHLRSATQRLRVSELCWLLRELGTASAALGRERVNTAETLLTLVLDLCGALTSDRTILKGFLSIFRLQSAWAQRVAHLHPTQPQEGMADSEQADPADLLALEEVKAVVSLFLCMAINRHCLRLDKLIRQLCEAVERGTATPHAIDVLTSLFTPPSALEVWDVDRVWLDAAIYEAADDVFPLVPALLNSAPTPSPATIATVMRVLNCRPFLLGCFRSASALLQRLLTVKREEQRLPLFEWMDDAFRMNVEREDSGDSPDALARGMDGMEGVSPSVLQELVRIRRLWAKRYSAPVGPVPLASLNLASRPPHSLPTLLAALSVSSLPRLHLPFYFALRQASESERIAFIDSLLAQSAPPLAPLLLQQISATDAVVCSQVVERVNQQIAAQVEAVLRTLTPSPSSVEESLAASLLARLRSPPAVPASAVTAPRWSSLLASLSWCATFTDGQRTETARRVVGHLNALAQVATSASPWLLSSSLSAAFLSAVDVSRLCLQPLLSHVDFASAKPGGLDDLLKASLSLLHFPLSALSHSPHSPPFSSFLSFFSLTVDRARWQAALLAPSQKAAPRPDQQLFELHSSHLTLARQRPLASEWADAIARCIPTAQGGALTDEPLLILSPAIAPQTQPQGAGAAAGSAGGTAAAAATRQPLDPWMALESCGAGPVLDAVWESSHAVRRAAPQ